MSDPNYESQSPLAPSPPPMYPTPAAPLEPAPGAVASMVCGIIGVVVGCTGLVMGIIALVQRKKAMEHIQAQPGRYGGQGFCTAGLVLGIISIIYGSGWAIGLIIWLIGILFLGAIAASAPMMTP